jgi:hypothetical protein
MEVKLEEDAVADGHHLHLELIKLVAFTDATAVMGFACHELTA